MNLRRLLLASSLATLISLPTVSFAEDDHTPLGEQMEVIGDAFRQLRRQAGDAEQNASTLELLETIHAAAQHSLDFKPEYTADKPAGEQAHFVESFKEDMHAFIAIVEEAIAAVKAGDNAKAEELVGKMRDTQRSGHKAYRRPKD